MHEARWWESTEDGWIHCFACPRQCKIGPEKTGFCGVRANQGGKLILLAHSHPAAANVDPVEKKPLFHWLPGTQILSLGTTGCNLGCAYCQNHDLARAKHGQLGTMDLPPEEAVRLALQHNCSSIAFTYNEPTIWAEYAIDIATVARREGLGTATVTNGYITPEARKDLYRWIDATNVDLKSFGEEFYQKLTLAHLQPVLDTLEWLHDETDVWVEITNLIIPTMNDSPEEIEQMVGWVLEHMGDEVPLHLTAFRPAFKMTDLPRTPPETLTRAREQAHRMGMKFVYEGNVAGDGNHTRCPGCNRVVIHRTWHSVERIDVVDGACRHCGQAIPIITSIP